MRRATVAWLSVLLLAGSTILPFYGQTNSPISPQDSANVSLFEYVTKIPKRSKAINLNLEMHAGLDADFISGKMDEIAFRFKNIKIDISGEINDKLFYWYRQALNGNHDGQVLDNLNKSIEYAYIGYKINERLTLSAGKLDAFYGGFEYEKNPLMIYEYSDMNEFSPCYLAGIAIGYQPNTSQEIRFEITNNKTGSMEDAFGRLPEDVSKPKVPLFYTLNWNGEFFDQHLNMRYSISSTEQAKGRYMFNIFTGQSITFGPLYAYFDVMYSRGELDPLGIITSLFSDETEEEVLICMKNVDYLSLVSEVQYQFHPKWKAFAKGMYETASTYKTHGEFEKGKYRTAWGYQGGIEFYPMGDNNLHLFLAAMGRTYKLTQRATTQGAGINDQLRLALGFIYRLPLY